MAITSASTLAKRRDSRACMCTCISFRVTRATCRTLPVVCVVYCRRKTWSVPDFRRGSSLLQQVCAAGAVCPVLPGALRLWRLGLIAGTGGARVYFTDAQGLELAELRGLLLHPRVARQVHRHAHDVDERARGRCEAVPAHQRDVVLREGAGQVATLVHVGDRSEERRVG